MGFVALVDLIGAVKDRRIKGAAIPRSGVDGAEARAMTES